MFTSPSPDIIAAGEADARARALDLGRVRAEVAADLHGDLQDAEARAAFVSEFAQAFADSFMEGAREERARIRGILSVPNASMLMPNGNGGMCHLRSDADGVVRSEKRQPRTPFSARSL